jgi:hypothetical protein
MRTHELRSADLLHRRLGAGAIPEPATNVARRLIRKGIAQILEGACDGIISQLRFFRAVRRTIR